MSKIRASRSNQLSLSSSFWSSFVEQHWEKSPLVIKRPFGSPLAAPDEFFGALVKASNQYRQDGTRSRLPVDHKAQIRFNIENAQLMTDTERYIPDLNDSSVEGYINRVTRQLDGKPFELIVHHFQAHSIELWMRMRDFFRGLYELIGIPAEKSEAVVFLRNHAPTSFGLHKDDASVFMFILNGRKKILAWPNDRFVAKGDMFCTMDYEPFRDEATILEGEPGDIIYWPSSYWHVGESSGEWSASISLGLRLNYQPFADVVRHLIRLVSDRLGQAPRIDTYPFDPNSLRQSATEMPGEIRTAIDVLREVSLSADIEQVNKLAWLNRVTGFGFLRVPPPLPPGRLAEDEVIYAQKDYPIVWLPWSEGRMACSANGHSFTLRESNCVIKMIERLNTGSAYRVKDLIEESAGSSTHDSTTLLQYVLGKLYSMRAIEHYNSAECESVNLYS
jgi:hypothetical protein